MRSPAARDLMMHFKEPKPGMLINPFDHNHVPFEPTATSEQRQWVGVAANEYRDLLNIELDRPAVTHHALILFLKPPTKLEMRCEGINRYSPPAGGWVSFVPAETPIQWRWHGRKDSLHVFLEPELIARVAEETFGLDPARVKLPALDGLQSPHLRSALLAVGDELRSDAGGRLVAESLANLLAVHLIRHVSAPREPSRSEDGVLPRAKLCAAIEFIEENLNSDLTLERIATATHLSTYHFARQFKAAIGLPPHQYVIMRRVERARELLYTGDPSLAEVAARVGFSDQSQFSHHFKRIVGVTPGQFRKSTSR